MDRFARRFGSRTGRYFCLLVVLGAGVAIRDGAPLIAIPIVAALYALIAAFIVTLFESWHYRRRQPHQPPEPLA